MICSVPLLTSAPTLRPSVNRMVLNFDRTRLLSGRREIRTTASLATMAASPTRVKDVALMFGASKTISRRAARLARKLAWPRRSSRAWALSGMIRRAMPTPASAAAEPSGRASVKIVTPPRRVARSTGSPRSFL